MEQKMTKKKDKYVISLIIILSVVILLLAFFEYEEIYQNIDLSVLVTYFIIFVLIVPIASVLILFSSYCLQLYNVKKSNEYDNLEEQEKLKKKGKKLYIASIIFCIILLITLIFIYKTTFTSDEANILIFPFIIVACILGISIITRVQKFNKIANLLCRNSNYSCDSFYYWCWSYYISKYICRKRTYW